MESEGGEGEESVTVMEHIGSDIQRSGACAVALSLSLSLSLYAAPSASLAQSAHVPSQFLLTGTSYTLRAALTSETAPPLTVTPESHTVTSGMDAVAVDLLTVTQGLPRGLSGVPTATVALTTPYTTSEDAQQLGLLNG